MQKTTAFLWIVVAALAGLIVGHSFWSTQQHLAGTSPSGSTFASAKFAAVAINVANTGANGTSTSILNTDTNDRYVSAFKLGCSGIGNPLTAYTGAGLASWKVQIGTTSTAAPVSFSSNIAISNTGFVIGTSTTNIMIASSTLLIATSSYATLWPANTYMTFFFNATTTGTCSIGLDYFGS